MRFLLYKSPIQGGNKGFRGVLTFFRIACIYEKTPTVYYTDDITVQCTYYLFTSSTFVPAYIKIKI